METTTHNSSPQSVTELDFNVDQRAHPSPRDWRDQFIYFLLVDRFDNNADLTAYDQNNVSYGRDSEQGHRFQGGNLRGIIRRLDYIQNLGCTAIWLSPILKNRQDLDSSYHGYGIQDFLEVDPRFGNLEDLKQLTLQAHQRGMYVIMDVVINHAGDVWGYPDDNPYFYSDGQSFPLSFWREVNPAKGFQNNDAIWPSELQKPEAFKRQGQIRDWNNSQESRDGDFLSLKELNLPNAEILDTMIKVYKNWIAQTDIDGFRIDTVKHMENAETAIFCNSIREYAQRIGKLNFFLFGEIVADDNTIQSYIGRNSRIAGTHERFPSLDAALDFPLYFILEDVIKGFSNPEKLRYRYDAFHTQYTDHGEAGKHFVTFVDNHDQMSRPYRRFMHNNPFPKQAVLAISYLLTSQGVPCIYYGTEQGFDGGGDNDKYVRECMFGGSWGAFDSQGRHFFDSTHEIYQGIQAIAQLRLNEPTLRYGRQYFREISGNGINFGYPQSGQCILAFSRILDSEEILIAMNLTQEQRTDFVTIDRNLSGTQGELQNLLLTSSEKLSIKETNGRANVQLKLPPHGIGIYKRIA